MKNSHCSQKLKPRALKKRTAAIRVSDRVDCKICRSRDHRRVITRWLLSATVFDLRISVLFDHGELAHECEHNVRLLVRFKIVRLRAGRIVLMNLVPSRLTLSAVRLVSVLEIYECRVCRYSFNYLHHSELLTLNSRERLQRFTSKPWSRSLERYLVRIGIGPRELFDDLYELYGLAGNFATEKTR